MNELKAVPVDFVQTATGIEPADPALYELVKVFCTAQFGRVPDFEHSLKSWAAVKMRPEGGYEKVLGLNRLDWMVDCSVFHVEPPEKTDDRKKLVEDLTERYAARDMLIARAKAFLEDKGYRGGKITIFVERVMRQSWEKFFKREGMRDADRVILEL
jgi:hypothetical protein